MDITVDKDLANATLRIETRFDHPIEKVWELFANPRKLERWWGPPTHPATVVRHELEPGGVVHYFMTDPEGNRYHGIWRVISVEAPARIVADDYFADEEGAPVEGMPTSHFEYTFEAVDGGTVLRCVSRYDTVEELQKTLDMGVEEGLRGAMSQMEPLLAEG